MNYYSVSGYTYSKAKESYESIIGVWEHSLPSDDPKIGTSWQRDGVWKVILDPRVKNVNIVGFACPKSETAVCIDDDNMEKTTVNLATHATVFKKHVALTDSSSSAYYNVPTAYFCTKKHLIAFFGKLDIDNIQFIGKPTKHILTYEVIFQEDPELIRGFNNGRFYRIPSEDGVALALFSTAAPIKRAQKHHLLD